MLLIHCPKPVRELFTRSKKAAYTNGGIVATDGLPLPLAPVKVMLIVPKSTPWSPVGVLVTTSTVLSLPVPIVVS